LGPPGSAVQTGRKVASLPASFGQTEVASDEIGEEKVPPILSAVMILGGAGMMIAQKVNST
jgi:hypothetical protein